MNTQPTFTVYPAIDILDGRVVRLAQGDYDRQTPFDVDPLVLAKQFANEGATWMHLVDLSAAKQGGYSLHRLVNEIKSNTHLNIQSGGGIREPREVAQLLHAGVDRIVIGSMAVRDPATVCKLFDDHDTSQLTIALDMRTNQHGQWTLPSHGWTEQQNADQTESVLAHYHAIENLHVLSTDISRDGMMRGLNLSLYETLKQQAPTWRIQASGGVRHQQDVLAAKQAGLAGVVMGKAMLEGKLSITQALAC